MGEFALRAEPVATRTLGCTMIPVGAIGFGCMGLTGVYETDRRDDRRSAAAVHRALDLGMTYLDTSDSFGPFGNERFVGEVLGRRRAEAVLATKVGVSGRADGTYHHNASPEHIRAAVEDSLRRLRTDHLDVYLLQAVDPAVPLEESWGAMGALVAEGKVRTLGIRSSDLDVIVRAQQVFPVSVVCAELSYWEQGNLGLARWAAARGIAFAASSPLGRGFLTGTLHPGRGFKWTDLRSKLPKFSPEALPQHLGVLEPLRAVAREHGVKPGQIALAWLLSAAPSIIPIPGSTDPDHVSLNAAAAGIRLTRQDLAVLAGGDR